MKNVLFIAYPFPPAGGAGVKRTLKFIKFLPKYKWNPIILTVKDGNFDVVDQGLLRICNKVEIVRAVSFENLIKKNVFIGKHEHGTIQVTKSIQLAQKETFKGKLRNIVRNLLIPDSHLLWLPDAVLKGFIQIKRKGIKTIYSTGPTFTDHMVGLILKKITNTKLIIDYRDAWMGNPTRRKRSKIFEKIEELIERNSIKNAKYVIATTDGIAKDLKERYKPKPIDKIITIPNGFDEEDKKYYCPESIKKNETKIYIVHTGRLGLERNPKKFIMALSSLLNEKSYLKRKIILVFVGMNLVFDDGKTIYDYVDEYELSENVIITGFVSRQESLEYQASADILLLIIGEVHKNKLETYGLSGKIFDYALSGKPIFAVSQDGESAKFIKKCNIGCVVDHSDINKIKERLYIEIENLKKRKSKYLPDKNEIKKYDFKILTQRLSALLDCCEPKNADYNE